MCISTDNASSYQHFFGGLNVFIHVNLCLRDVIVVEVNMVYGLLLMPLVPRYRYALLLIATPVILLHKFVLHPVPHTKARDVSTTTSTK